MQVELTPSDVRLIEAALDAYEHQPAGECLTGMMLGAMFSPKEERESWKREAEQESNKMKVEAQRRKTQVILLRAKLIQSSAVASEHEEVQP